jgi:hypothetical protein
MSIWTQTELEEQISTWKAALKACAVGQEYRTPDRTLTKADLPEIRKTLTFLEHELNRLQGRSGPVFVSGRVRRG